MPVGQLTVELAVALAKFQSDMGRAAAVAEQNARRMDAAFTSVRRTLETLGVGISIGAFAALIKGTIDAQDHLAQLSKSTGIAVDTLGGLGFAASQTGGSLEAVATAFKRFNVNVAEALGGNKELQETFARMGISLKDLHDLSPDQLFAKVADKFASWEDGANKAAFGSKLFGRAYQEILPTLDQGGAKLLENVEYFKRFGGVTDETARKAEEFNSTMTKVSLLNSAFAKNIAAALLPTLQALATEYVNVKEKGDGFKSGAEAIAGSLNVLARFALIAGFYIKTTGEAIGGLAAAGQALAHGEFGRALEIFRLNDQDVARQKAVLDQMLAALANARQEAATGVTTGGTKTRAPNIPTAAGLADDPTRKLLQQAIKDLDASIEEEKKLLSARAEYLKLYYERGDISTSDYYAQREATISDGLAFERTAYDQEIAAIRDYIAKADTEVKKAEGGLLLIEAIRKRSLAEQDAAKQATTLWFEQQRAAENYAREIANIHAQILSLKGDTADAAKIEFDTSHADQRRKLAADGNQAALDELARIEDITVARAKLNDLETVYSTILGNVEIIQSRIDLAVQTGNATEIEGLVRRGQIAAQYAAQLSKVADAYAEVARVTGDPKALLAAEQLRLKIEQLAAESDALAKKFRDVFVSDFTSALVDVATGTKKLKDAFTDLAKSLLRDLDQIAAKNLSESLFGKGGALGGVPDFFAKIFGGGGLFGAGAETASLTTAGTTLTTAGVSLDSAAAALTAAAGALSAGGLGSAAGSVFGGGGESFFGGFFADGGNPPVGSLSIVGERGPEAIIPRSPVSVIPLSGRAGPIHITVNMPPGTDSRSATMAARETGLAVQLALRRS